MRVYSIFTLLFTLSRFVDRDVFLRHRGGGIGAVATRHLDGMLAQDQHALQDEDEDEAPAINADDASRVNENVVENDEFSSDDSDDAAAISGELEQPQLEEASVGSSSDDDDD